MSLTSQNASDGYLGHFASLTALTSIYSAVLYPGRRATVEFSTGVATWVYSDGVVWQRGASTSFTETRVDSGIGVPYNGDWQMVYAPTSAPAQSIILGRSSRFSYASAQSNSGLGHQVAGVNWYTHDGAGNPSLAIAGENKVDVNAVATLSNVKFVENQLSTNVAGATISTLTGSTNRVTGNAGTITLFIGNTVSVSGNTGTIGTLYGYHFPDLSGAGAAPGATRYAFINSDANAPIISAAPVMDQSLDYSSPTAGATVTINTRKQIHLMTPAATLATITINFVPKSTVVDGQTLELTTTQALSAITWGGNGAASVYNAPASMVAGQTVRFRYFATIDWWVRV